MYALSASHYKDSIRQVAGESLANSLGDVEGLAGQALYRNTFYKQLFYYMYGFGLDIGFPKTINDYDEQYTVDNNRLEVPFLIGTSVWTSKSRIYLGTGYSFTRYELTIKHKLGSQQKYVGVGLGRVYHIGIIFPLSRTTSFYSEFHRKDISIKGYISQSGDKRNVYMNPNSWRFYFGIMRPLTFW